MGIGGQGLGPRGPGSRECTAQGPRESRAQGPGARAHRLPGCPPRSEHDCDKDDKDSFHRDDSDDDGPNTDDDSTIVGFCKGSADKWAECVQEVLGMPKLSDTFKEARFSHLASPTTRMRE